MTTRASTKNINDRPKGGGNFIPYKEMMLDLKPTDETSVISRRVRLIGVPLTLVEFNGYKRNPDDSSKDPVKVPFPDADQNKSFTRIGHDDPDKCPWRALGYKPRTMYAINVIERGKAKDGSEDKVRILYKGGSIFDEFAKEEQANREINAKLIEEDGADAELKCVNLGDLVAHDVIIKAEKNPKALGGVEYSVSIYPKVSKITENDIELLRKAGEPSAEMKEALRTEFEEAIEVDETLPAEYHDWFDFGYDLRKQYRFTPRRDVPSGAEPTASESTCEFPSEDEEDAPAAPAVAVNRPKSGRTAAAPAAAPAASQNFFDNVDDDGDEDAPQVGF